MMTPSQPAADRKSGRQFFCNQEKNDEVAR